MRKNKLLFFFFLLGLSVLSVAKEFIVPAQTVYNEEIIGLKQRIVVQGEANKDIVLLGGELILSGQARRDVVLIGADCTLKPGSVIAGDVVVLGGRIKVREGARIRGRAIEFNNLRETMTILRQSLGGGTTGVTSGKVLGLLLSLLFWLVLSVVTFTLIPAKVEGIADLLGKNPLRNTLWGLLLYLTAISILIFSAFLSLFLIGIPFLVVSALGIFFLKVVGRASFSWWLGEVVRKRALKGRILSPVVILLLGLIPLTVVRNLPFHVGGALLFLCDAYCFGAIFLSFHKRFRRSREASL